MASARDDSHWINSVPKSGTAVPNRIFVGGISGNTKEDDLTNVFSKFGNVKSTKIIVDKAGISKGYGFVTFDTEEEAQKVLLEVECVVLKDRKLNIAPAVKKQPYSRSTLESNSVSSASVVWPAQHFPASSGFSRDSLYYPQASWPVMWPPHFYLQQQCHLQSAQTGYPQYVYSIAPADYPLQAMGSVSGSDYSENSSADVVESSKNKRPTAAQIAEYDQGRQTQTKQSQARIESPQRLSTASIESNSNYLQSTPVHHHLPHPVFAKTVNGVTVMAYPSPFVMGSPALLHMKDGHTETDSVLAEIGFLHSPMANGTLTPPATPLASMSCEFNANTSIESHRKN